MVNRWFRIRKEPRVGYQVLYFSNSLEDDLAQLRTQIGSAKEATINQQMTYGWHGRMWASIPVLSTLKTMFPDVHADLNDYITDIKIKEMRQERINYQHLTNKLNAIRTGRMKGPSQNFKFSGTPYDHQVLAFDFLATAGSGALFADCGVGKTYIVLHLIKYHLMMGNIKRVLIACPLSIIKNAWMGDNNKFTPELNLVSLWRHGYKAKEKRELVLEENPYAVISNYETIRIMSKQLQKFKPDMIVVDESSRMKNNESQIKKTLSLLSGSESFNVIMSGTPSPNTPMELWPQFDIVNRGATLGPNYTDFKAKYFKFVEVGDRSGQGFWVNKRNAPEDIGKLIAPRTIRFKASECLDLPDQVEIVKTVKLPPELRKHYDEMAEDYLVRIEDEVITANNILTEIMKLRQITSGFIINRDGDPIRLSKKNPKMDELKIIIEDIMVNNKAIIWGHFRWEIEELARIFNMYKPGMLYGGVNQNRKDEYIDDFLEKEDHRLLINHPKSASVGLNLVAAAYSIWFSQSYSHEDDYQANKRIDRSGQKKKNFKVYIVAEDTIDETMRTSVKSKENIEGRVLNEGVKYVKGLILP